MRTNPRASHQRDLFGGVTAMVIPLAELTEEEIRSLPRDRFSEAEWDELDEDMQEYVRENDPDSQTRITNMISEFVKRHEWATNPEPQFVRERFDEDFDQLFSEHADDLINFAQKAGYDVDGILTEYKNAGYTEDQIEKALLEALQDNNNYVYDYDTQEHGRAFFKARASESIYIERSDLDEILKGMFPDEIEVALKEINNKTYLSLKPKDLEGKYELSIDDYADFYADADPDWDKIEEAVKDTLSDKDPEAVPELPPTPPEERTIHKFKDGSYVLDLLPQELPAEGKAQGMCVGRPDMGYMRAVATGKTKILSLRRPSGKPLLTFEVSLDSNGRAKSVEQIKGKANRLPGWDVGKGRGEVDPETMKRDEVLKAVEVVEKLGIQPEDVSDLNTAMLVLKSRFLSPPKKGNPHTCRHCGGSDRGFCAPVHA